MESKVSKIAMIVLIAVAVIVAGLFYLGGNIDDSAEYVEPIFTGALMGLMYAYVAIAAVLVIIGAVINLILDFQKDSKKALKSIGGVGALILIMVISYFVSSGAPVKLLGDAEEVSTATLKMVDMQLYTIYALVVIACLMVVYGMIAKRIK